MSSGIQSDFVAAVTRIDAAVVTFVGWLLSGASIAEALAPAVEQMMERLGKPYIKKVAGRTTYPRVDGEATLV